MSPIANLTLTREPLNVDDTYSEGDTITGVLSFELKKDAKVKEIFVKAKGDANVRWTEGGGDDEKSYSAHRRYFKVKQHLVDKKDEGTVLPKGVHQFKFSLTIPQENMPPSFIGAHGKIVYMLEAKISRTWWRSSTKRTEINFLPKSMQRISQIKNPQSGSVDKKVGVFSKKEVQMSASVNRNVCSPGDILSAFAKISNTSSKSMTPKFKLDQKTEYRAQGSTNTSYKTLFKALGKVVGPNSEATVSCLVKVPTTAIYSIDNCEILTVGYYLKVYLDISFAVDPEVKFPLTIAPSSSSHLTESKEPYPSGDAGAPGYSDFLPPVNPNIPEDQSSFALPPSHPVTPQAYAHPPDVYPPQPPLMYGVYNNPAPQGPSPYGSPFSTSSSSSELHLSTPSPAFHSPPSALQFQPPPSSQPPSAPPYNLIPSSSVMNTDFLSQSDDGPLSYSLLFKSGAEAPEKSDSK